MIPRVQDDAPAYGRDAIRPPRLSIAKVMAVVATIAINMATLRTLHAYDEDLDQGVALTGFALQFGVFQSIRRRGRGRTFWIGFVALGSAAMMSFAWCVTFHGSTMFLLWSEYTRYSNKYLNLLTHVWDFYNRTRIDVVCVITQAIAWSVPQLIIASIGGLMARSIFGRCSGGSHAISAELPRCRTPVVIPRKLRAGSELVFDDTITGKTHRIGP
jgi:hypothetical protein